MNSPLLMTFPPLMEHRMWHVVAADLMVSEGAMKMMVNLEKSMLARRHMDGPPPNSPPSLKTSHMESGSTGETFLQSAFPYPCLAQH